MMHRKGAQDAKRARQFARLIREITVAPDRACPTPPLIPAFVPPSPLPASPT